MIEVVPICPAILHFFFSCIFLLMTFLVIYSFPLYQFRSYILCVYSFEGFLRNQSLLSKPKVNQYFYTLFFMFFSSVVLKYMIIHKYNICICTCFINLYFIYVSIGRLCKLTHMFTTLFFLPCSSDLLFRIIFLLFKVHPFEFSSLWFYWQQTLQIYLSESIFTLPSFLKDIFARYRI